MNNIKITVFTPTYNRAKTLTAVFDSLKSQSFIDFEWIIIDDGSTDDTEFLVKTYIRDNDKKFSIYYVKQKNSGKHIAQNKAVDMARGELFIPLDSDDTIVDEALKILWEGWESIPKENRASFSGVACHCMDQFGNRIGSEWPFSNFISNDLEVYFKYRVTGEKWGAIRVDIMRNYKNANVKGHFLDESTVWFRIAKSYQKLYLDKCLRIYEVRQDSVQKRNRESELRNAESKLHANLIYINEFYSWYIKYNFKELIKRSLKIVYYSSLKGKRIIFGDGIIKQVDHLLCKLVIIMASPYFWIEKYRRRKR